MKAKKADKGGNGIPDGIFLLRGNIESFKAGKGDGSLEAYGVLRLYGVDPSSGIDPDLAKEIRIPEGKAGFLGLVAGSGNAIGVAIAAKAKNGVLTALTQPHPIEPLGQPTPAIVAAP